MIYSIILVILSYLTPSTGWSLIAPIMPAVEILLPLSPLAIALGCLVASARISRFRWLLHLCAVSAIILGAPLYVYLAMAREEGTGFYLLFAFPLYLLFVIAGLAMYGIGTFPEYRLNRQMRLPTQHSSSGP